MTNKIKSLIAYCFIVILGIILTSCANTLPVKVGFQDEGIKTSYSSKGGLELVIDKTSNK